MNKIRNAIYEIHHMDDMATKDQWVRHLHPLAKLFVTFFYIFTLVSFSKYDFGGVLGMGIYLLIMFCVADISLKRAARQMRIILLLTIMVGIANPFLDYQVVTKIGGFVITGGMVSMITLMLKGIYAVLASYFLIVTTSIEQICYGLQCLHLPKPFLTMILLIYRYMIVLLKEAERISLSYEMRAPGQKGIHWKVWGSLAGQLLLRSIDRAQVVYESMLLRGYDGTFQLRMKKKKTSTSVLYALIWILIFFFYRRIPVFWLIGQMMGV